MNIDLEKLADELLAEIYEFAEDALNLSPDAFDLLAESINEGTRQSVAEATAAGASPELLKVWKYFEELPPGGGMAVAHISMALKFLKQTIEKLRVEGPTTELAKSLMGCAGGLHAADAFACVAFYPEDWIGGKFVDDERLDPALKSAAASRLAAAGAAARHAPNYARQAAAKAWYSANRDRFGSVDHTAEALARQMGVVFDTARKWIRLWRREERQAAKG